jgi:DNA-cytosine methyltransferase
MGGSPCQGFSFAGKQLAFDDPRSMLFFEFHKAISYLQPKYFLLENVKMKKEYLDVISEYMGVEPIFINSSLVSAQSRQRYYWTNIPNVEQPEERGIVLRDILEDQPEPSNLISNKPQRVGTCVEQVKIRKHEVDILNLQHLLRVFKSQSKKTNRQIAEETNLPITKVEHWFRTDSSFAIPSDDVWLKLKEVLSIPVDTFDAQIMEFEYRDGVYESTQRVYGDHGKSPTLTASNSDQLIQTSDKPQHIGTAVDINGHDQIKRVYSPDGKSPTVTTCGGGHREPKVVAGAWRGRYQEDGLVKQKLHLNKQSKSYALTAQFPHKMNFLTKDEVYWRKLTPLECERLQTVPDNYTNHVSNTQRYKMLGNGWTVDVIAHILKNMEVN